MSTFPASSRAFRMLWFEVIDVDRQFKNWFTTHRRFGVPSTTRKPRSARWDRRSRERIVPAREAEDAAVILEDARRKQDPSRCHRKSEPAARRMALALK